jgi:hypothetical protein
VPAVVLIESDGSTSDNLRVWQQTRAMLGTFQDAILAGLGGDHRYALSRPGAEWDEGDRKAWRSPAWCCVTSNAMSYG